MEQLFWKLWTKRYLLSADEAIRCVWLCIYKHLEHLPDTSTQIFDWKPCQRLSPKQARQVNQRLAYTSWTKDDYRNSPTIKFCADITSDVMYKKYKRFGLHAPRFVSKILLSKLVKRKKIRPDLLSKNLLSRPNLLRSRAIMAFKCDRRWLLFFGYALKWTYLWNTSLLFDLN